MSETITLPSQVREKTGTIAARKLRREGLIPANVYGKGKDNLAIAISRETIEGVVHAGNHLVELNLAGGTQTAILREVQWNAFGTHIQHVDLVRIDAGETVELDIEVILKGDAAGVLAGGVLEHTLRALTISCPANAIPDHIEVNVANLEIGDSIHLGELQLPANVTTEMPDDTLVAHVDAPISEEQLEAELATTEGAIEPEVVGDEKEEEGTED